MRQTQCGRPRWTGLLSVLAFSAMRQHFIERIESRRTPNKTLHTNRRPALGFGLSTGLSDNQAPHHVIVRAAVGELPSEVIRQ